MAAATWSDRMVALINAPPEEQWRIIRSMSASDLLAVDADFESWAHRSQLPPAQDGWRTWMIMAGRGFGKTRAGAEWVEKLARSRPGVRIALVGATIDEARRVMIEGVSGVLSVAKRRRHKVRSKQCGRPAQLTSKPRSTPPAF